MNRDELILDILEKLHDKVEATHKDITDIKIQQAIHDEIVKAHEARSTSLEELVKLTRKDSDDRIKILEKDAQFNRNFVKSITILAAIGTFLVKAWPFLLSHL